MQTIEILYSVGKGGKNKAIDVALIQALLKATFLDLRRQFRLGNNDVDDDYSLLEVNGSISDVLIVAIKQFQQDIVEMKIPDGRVDPNGLTFKKLIEIQKTPPVSLMKTIFKPADFEKKVLNTISTKRFKDFFKQYHGLTISKGEDLAGFFNKIKMDSKIICFEWAAYMLATAYHETTFSFLPRSEAGKGRGCQYAQVFDVTDTHGIRGIAGKVYENVYYGRGYVQITWDYNYKNLGKALDIGDNLYINPDSALEPDMAYQIMSFGMRHGRFTGKKLSDYITENNVDYFNARRIINGTDHAAKIADYALSIECLLRLAACSLSDLAKLKIR